MSHETLFVERAGAILTVTLNRPKQLNAINRVMAQELDDLARSLEADRAVHVVIITGAGDRAFLAGADITEFQEPTPVQALEFSQRIQRLYSGSGWSIAWWPPTDCCPRPGRSPRSWRSRRRSPSG